MGFKKINDYYVGDHQSGGGLINMHLLYLPTFLSARILPQQDKEEIRNKFAEFKEWLWNNYRQDDDFWKNNILSAGKLRKQFDQLKLKMPKESKGRVAEWLLR
jgi:hypothetical protein